MENTPTAPTEAPQAPASVETPTTTEPAQPAPAQPTIDLGLTAEQAEKFKTFIANSGGFDNAFSKLKTDVSAPKSAQPAPEAQPQNEPTSQPQPQPEQPAYQAPQGSISAQEFLAQQYFKALAGEEKYAPIAKEIANGSLLKEMAAFNIKALNQDGSINDTMVRRYLDLKAQTVPAKPTETTPDASAAPTVDYITVGDKIENLDQAYQVIMQPGHQRAKEAEEYIREQLNGKQSGK